MSRREDVQGKRRAVPVTLTGRSIVPATGYSRLELERAGLTEEDAHRLGLVVDPDRRSMVGSNVMQLRRLGRTQHS